VSHVAIVVKVTEISQVVTETVDHLDDSCHSSDLAGHVLLPPEVDYDDRPKPEVARETEVSWRPHQQCVTSLPRHNDIITGNKMAAVDCACGTVLTAF